MNKLTKIGLSALCGSLASVSAVNAGTLEVLGTAEATWTTKGSEVTGNPLGMNSGLSFKGSGELDGGQTFSVLVAATDKHAYSSAGITLTTNNLGTFKISSAEGSGGIGGYDDNMPRAYEEVWDTGISTNVNLQKGVGSSSNISWTTPKFAGTKLHIAYAPDNDGTQNNNKGVSADASNAFGAGWDIVLDAGSENGGFNLFLGASETEQSDQKKSDAFLKNLGGDHQEGVVGLQVKIGPLALGGQVSAERLRTQTAGATNYYGNTSWGAAFNINDDLSISYGQTQHVQVKTKKMGQNPNITNESENLNEYTPKSWMKGTSVQAAWTVGGIGLKYAQSDYDNTAYGFDTKAPKESRIFSVSLAF